MVFSFTDEQKELLSKFNFAFDISGELDEEEILEIDEAISDYFTQHGISEDNVVNDIGLLCESIIDML